MRRLSLTRRGGAILVALALLVGLPAATGVAAITGASPEGVAANAPGAAPAPAALAVRADDASLTDGSASPHFAFGRVLNQATGTETVTPTVTNTATPTGTVTTATPTPTGTLVTPTSTPTTGVPTAPGVSGTPGVGCTTTIGGTCTAVGAAAGSCTKTSSSNCAITATGPVNATVGGIPFLFIPTTANPNGEQITCTATTAALTTTCNGTTAGDPLCGSTATVDFPLTTGGFGTVTGLFTCVGQSTLIVCKQVQILNPGGIGGIGGFGGVGGFGGLNPPGPLGGIGFNPLGPIGGPNTFGGDLGLGLQGLTVTFTTPPGGPAIPAITLPPGQLGPVCAAGVTLAAGTVAVTEVVPAGFTLQSVTGGTLAGNTATATITAGQTTTLTFINVPSNIIIPPPPLLPPPPLQFLPPPPPPLLPPPPIGGPPLGGFPPPDNQFAVPIVPEADTLALLLGGLGALGLLGRWRARRRARR
jgi:hypothetical protein